MHTLRFCLFSFAAILTVAATAQNTGGVIGSVINEGHHSWQYRSTFDPDSHGLAQRLHYEAALSGSTMWRVIGQVRKTDQREADFDFFQGEWYWQITADEKRWQRGLRLDARVRGDGRPGLLGLNFTNQFALGSKWSARAVLLSNIDIGDGAGRGINLETRSSISYHQNAQTMWGVETFDTYGSTAKFNEFKNQRHQIGPFVFHNFGDGWQIFANALFGITEASPDTNLRIWLTQSW